MESIEEWDEIIREIQPDAGSNYLKSKWLNIIHKLALVGVIKMTVGGKPCCEFISSGGVYDFAIKWSDSDEIWFSTEYARKIWNTKPSPFPGMIDICQNGWIK